MPVVGLSGAEEEGAEGSDRERQLLEDLVTRFGFREPDRGDLESNHIVWRRGKPDYTRANYQVGTVLMWPREIM